MKRETPRPAGPFTLDWTALGHGASESEGILACNARTRYYNPLHRLHDARRLRRLLRSNEGVRTEEDSAVVRYVLLRLKSVRAACNLA